MTPTPTQFGAHGRPPRNHGFRPPRPPELPLLALFLVALSALSIAYAQISISSMPSTTTLPALNTSSSVLDITLPPSPSLYLTLSICSLNSNDTQLPSVLVSTSPPDFELDERTTADRASGGTERANRRVRGGGLWSLSWDQGFANWTNPSDDALQGPVGMRLGFVQDQEIAEGNLVLQLRVSGDGEYLSQELGAAELTDRAGPPGRVLPSSLLLGDTTTNQALLFSPVLLAAPQAQPTYPNYTLPPAQMDLPGLPEFSLPTFDLVVVPTAASPTNQALDQSLCAIQAANSSTGSIAQASNMVVNATTTWSAIAGEEGYRTYWVVGGLQPGTNYTAWYTQGDGTLSQPTWFATKQCKLTRLPDL